MKDRPNIKIMNARDNEEAGIALRAVGEFKTDFKDRKTGQHNLVIFTYSYDNRDRKRPPDFTVGVWWTGTHQITDWVNTREIHVDE